MEKKIMDGNEACAYASYKFTEVAGIYPITPSSPMAEFTDAWSCEGKLNYFDQPVKVVEMQSEAGAAGMLHGSLQAGCLSTTYTASQGLLLMIPNMYKMAGERLPAVINVAARSLSTHALSIFGDHQDVYAARATGFAMLASSSAQQVMDLTGVAHLSALKGRVPFMNFFDGFRTSHELQKVELIDTTKLEKLIDRQALKEFKEKALLTGKAVTRGTAQNDDIYFQATEVRNKFYDELPDIVNKYLMEVSIITGRDYRPFNYYGAKDATKVIVAMGSVCETVKETIEYLNKGDEKLGLIEVHLYRPFSDKFFLEALPDSVKHIAVLDRTKEAGSTGEPLYLDVLNIINKHKLNVKVLGGRYGLSSKNTNPSMIKAVYDFIGKRDSFSGFTVGIEDDVTHLSIPVDDKFEIPNNCVEFLVYGFGSDGMVSSCKDIMKVTGGSTNANVQGYFQYDSKKSSGVTISHLRFSKNEIRSTYYVENPSLVVCTKDTYLKKYKMLNNIKENGTFILNTSKTRDEVLKYMSVRDQKILKNKNIKFYVIDAYDISSSVGLGNKISMIMELMMFKVSRVMDFDFAHNYLKESVEKRFAKKDKSVATNNIKAMEMSLDKLTLIDMGNVSVRGLDSENKLSFFETIDLREGDSLPVSAFLDKPDGTFVGGSTALEKRNIADDVPCYNKDNCINCNFCSLVCPHGVIRPFLLTKEEFEAAPNEVKAQTVEAIIDGVKYRYTIGISEEDCTGCKLCSNVCPGKKGVKALEMVENEGKNKIVSDYLFNKVSYKEVMNKATIKGSQFRKPLFEFSGACAGCGETPYVKLLTQLRGDNLVVANATGCSSIYGGSAPSTPYLVPWASSLFEDNAEYGFGMKIADKMIKERILDTIDSNLSKIKEEEVKIYKNYLKEINNNTANALLKVIDHTPVKELLKFKDYIKPKDVWLIGGDGWAYDIGFSGIDHVLANKENINILVLDTEVYSNTGGQSSKSSRYGSVAKFAAHGKETAKKDLAKIALTYPHVYVGTISMGANYQQAITVLEEANNYNGPSIVIAYSPCIEHGIKLGMSNSIDEEKKAVMSGYFPIFHYNPETDIFKLDCKPDFENYLDFLENENRYQTLKKIDSKRYRELVAKNVRMAQDRFNYYKSLETKKEDQN